MDVLQQVEKRGVVGFHMAGQQTCVDDEDVGSLGEGVVAAGGDD